MKEIYNLPLEIQMKIMTFTPHPLALLMKPVIKFFHLMLFVVILLMNILLIYIINQV